MGGAGPRTDVHVWIWRSARAPRVRVFALSGEERLRRILAAAGARLVHSGPHPPDFPPGTPALVLRSDVVYDERLVLALLGARSCALVVEDCQGREERLAARCDAGEVGRAVRWLAAEGGDEEQPASPRIVTIDDLVPPYDAKLRSVRPAFVSRLEEGAQRRIEEALYAASYKDVTDLVTLWLWPRPALMVTRALAHARVSPNLVTFLDWVLVALVTLLFAHGQYGTGLAAAWLMTFLDTVDGKLARVTLSSTRLGHAFDHGLDLVHPPFWYLAWGLSTAGASGVAGLDVATWITLLGYVVGRALEGLFLLVFKFEIHTWQRIDSWFRLVTARRNPNLILLTAGALVGLPHLGMVAVAVWTVASIAFHGVRVLMATAAHAHGRVLRAWQEPSVPRPLTAPALEPPGSLE